MRPQFVRDQVSDLELEETHVQNLMGTLNLSVQRDGWTDCVDLQVLFFRLTLDSATEFLFGQSVDSQTAFGPRSVDSNTSVGHVNSLDFATAFDRGQVALAVGLIEIIHSRPY